MKSTSWFTLEDCKMAFNLFCCVYGVGTLGMPGNFSRAGPAIAIVAMLFMAVANIYSSIVCSKIMLKAPRTVKTFGDLGEWCMGPVGRWIIVFFHTAVCVLIPCLYLVLGGTFLPGLFPDTFSSEVWIGFMAVSLMPICLIPTLKEGAGIALAGCLGTILADVLGIAILMRGMKGHPSVPKPDISFDQIAMTFGNLSLAYGAGIVIPALQRQHSEPERMPRVICVTLTIVSVFFITLASTGYSAIGCQIAGNLLFSIFPHPSTGLATLGFSPNKGWAILAFLFMQLHITVAFAVILHPALYVFERTLLGMHKRQAENDQHIQDIEAAADYVVADTPVENTDKATPTAEDSKAAMGPKAPRASKTGSVVSMVDIMREIDDEDAELAEYKGHEFKYIPMRIVLIVLMTALSIALKDHFSDLADFVGASAISVSCMIMPILFYFKKLWTTLPLWEKAFGSLVVVVCAVLGVYVSIQTGKALFKSGTPKPGAPVFEFTKSTSLTSTTTPRLHTVAKTHKSI